MSRAAHQTRALKISPRADAVVGLGLAAALTLVTCLAGVGDALGANTWVQLVLILIGVGLILTVI